MHNLRVEVHVGKDWLTDSYEVRWSVKADGPEPIASGFEMFGPLWEVDQVERLVAEHTRSLMSVWLRDDPRGTVEPLPQL